MKLASLNVGIQRFGRYTGAITGLVEFELGDSKPGAIGGKLISDLLDNRPDIRHLQLFGKFVASDLQFFYGLVDELARHLPKLASITIVLPPTFPLRNLVNHIQTHRPNWQARGLTVYCIVDFDMSSAKQADDRIVGTFGSLNIGDAVRFCCCDGHEFVRSVSMLKSVQKTHVRTTVIFSVPNGPKSWLEESVLRQDWEWAGNSFDIRVM